MVVLIILAFIGLVAALLVFAYLQHKRRREAFLALQQELGWRLTERDRTFHRRFDGFSPFGVGSGRLSTWIFQHDLDGVPFTVFSYRYQTHHHTKNGTRTQNHPFKVAAIEMPIAAPGLTISPENLFHKIADAFGGEDIDFESDEFSRRFWVKCPDRRFAYDVISPEMMAWLLEHDWNWQWRGTTLLLHRNGALHPDDVRPMLAMIQGFRERIPRHLVEASN